jgi:chemotaxis methyl-accepting protein methylase
MTSLRDELVRLAADEAGLDPDAVGTAAVQRFIERTVRKGIAAAALRARARARDPLLREALLSAVLVGETFFFREPEHFRLVRDVIDARPAASRAGLSAWSAGCASGEEAYSLAATLLATAGGRPVEVLGTDLSARALSRAEGGTYGKWSRRDAGPMLYPVGKAEGETLRVHDELRRTVRFARHNLLDPPPGAAGGFDVVFDVVMCRNVFVYLRADAARRVARHLRDALAEGGLLIVGTFGAIDDPALVPIGPRELGAYVRSPAGAAPEPRPHVQPRPHPPPRPRPRARETGAPPPAEPAADHVKIHLEAIHLIEARRFGEAEALLGALAGRASYVPALLELALLAARGGRPARAAELAARVLELLHGRDPEDGVTGPELLPVQYYTTSARTFLARLRGRA